MVLQLGEQGANRSNGNRLLDRPQTMQVLNWAISLVARDRGFMCSQV